MPRCADRLLARQRRFLICLDPAQSEEQKGMSSALLLSAIAFNALGTVLVAPSRRAATLPGTLASLHR